VPGWDVAGEVVAVGPAVTELAAGDAVVGYVQEDHVQRGAYAELIAARPWVFARKPAQLSWAEAAGLPLAGLTAYQALTRVLGVSQDEVLLVHAAAGGVGSMAVQIASILGARVIGTASEANHDYLRSLGAEPVTYGDSLAERVRELAPAGADAVLDLVGGEALEASPRIARSAARVASIVDPRVTELGGRFVVVRQNPADLLRLVEYVEQGKLTVHVSATFPLEDAAEAQRRSQARHGRGKIVLEVG
jgi:NADPH:quinone reductase-like Zn-dependent oxidoreductase